jgi:hypothetical protein
MLETQGARSLAWFALALRIIAPYAAVAHSPDHRRARLLASDPGNDATHFAQRDLQYRPAAPCRAPTQNRSVRTVIELRASNLITDAATDTAAQPASPGVGVRSCHRRSPINHEPTCSTHKHAAADRATPPVSRMFRVRFPRVGHAPASPARQLCVADCQRSACTSRRAQQQQPPHA